MLRILVLLLWIPAAWASLYDVRVAVPAEQDGNTVQIQQQALNTVLSRLTGRAALSDGRLLKFTDNAGQWIASWGFASELDEASRIATLSVSPSIRRELATLEIPLWTQPRPAQWLWMLVDLGEGRQPISRQSAPELWSALQQQADFWQLPLATPQWNDQDQAEVNTSELWGLFLDGVDRAAQRYSSDYTAGRILKAGDQWQMSIKTSDGRRLTTRYPSAQALAQGLYEFWRTPLVSRYAIAGQGQLDLAIEQLTSQGYANWIRVIRDLDGVDRVWPIFSNDQFTVLRIQTGATADQLNALLSTTLNFEPSALPASADLMVRWLP